MSPPSQNQTIQAFTQCVIQRFLFSVRQFSYKCTKTWFKRLFKYFLVNISCSICAGAYRGRGWPSKVKSQNQKSIFKVKSQNQKSNVNLRNKKSIRKLKSRNQMSISEARKSSFEFSLLTFDFDHPPYPLPY